MKSKSERISKSKPVKSTVSSSVAAASQVWQCLRKPYLLKPLLVLASSHGNKLDMHRRSKGNASALRATSGLSSWEDVSNKFHYETRSLLKHRQKCERKPPSRLKKNLWEPSCPIGLDYCLQLLFT